MIRTRSLFLVLAFVFVTNLQANPPYLSSPCPPTPKMAWSPLIHLHFQGPEGMHVGFLEPGGQNLSAPFIVGLRPGLRYRLRLSGFTAHPNVTLYPTIDVLSPLLLPRNAKSADHPAPVHLSSEELDAIVRGGMLTKVIVVENPDTAEAVSSEKHQPIEKKVERAQDPYKVASEFGRPIMVIRVGQREYDERELSQIQGGNVLYPGQHCLPPRNGLPPPMMRPPPHYECLRDGGDFGPRAHLTPDGQLNGLNPADTVAQYVDSSGTRRLAVPCPVCICVPRFMVFTHVLPPAGYESVGELGRVAGHLPHIQYSSRDILQRRIQMNEPDSFRKREQLAANVTSLPAIRLLSIKEIEVSELHLGPERFLGTQEIHRLDEKQKTILLRQVALALALSKDERTVQVGAEERVKAVGVLAGLGQVMGRLETREAVYLCEDDRTVPPSQPLQILKWASATSAQIGDVITFRIRYSNLGGRPISNIAISDSLTARLAYVPGTEKSDREAFFITQENEAGSLVLRWEIKDPLPPGKQGYVTFQARVR